MSNHQFAGPPTPKQRAAWDALVLDLTSAFEKAHRVGLPKTGHAMHEAVRQIGWEMAERIGSKAP